MTIKPTNGKQWMSSKPTISWISVFSQIAQLALSGGRDLKIVDDLTFRRAIRHECFNTAVKTTLNCLFCFLSLPTLIYFRKICLECIRGFLWVHAPHNWRTALLLVHDTQLFQYETPPSVSLSIHQQSTTAPSQLLLSLTGRDTASSLPQHDWRDVFQTCRTTNTSHIPYRQHTHKPWLAYLPNKIAILSGHTSASWILCKS